ncbi:right-handed parallel beta-helix repeat-containing protein [Dyadobacter tibetensis]|uniref:right-handed parallel beta-helix repeat-containing protein n=1 Tax=Dyadobacter tibetensis TaxID=1211851 RepID=UPI000470885D|nr:right-handed parallel beta-helix repeat-containing protein [Dyadobacter tibetensis]
MVPGADLTARAGADQQVVVGETVTLDGSSSTDGQNKPFEFSWSIIKKPTGSTVTLSSANTAKATFVPDEVGEYQAELTISNAGGKSTDKVIITAAAAEPETIDSDIKAKTLLIDRITNPNLPDYVITKNINVDAELTINPGVVIAFSRDTRLTVSDKGAFIAMGEADKPIRFEGREKTTGFWAGVQVNSSNGGNKMEFVEIMHAGAQPLFGSTRAGMALAGNFSAQMSIKNCTFSYNKGYGLYIGEGAALGEFSTNTFKNNVEAGININAKNVHNLDENSVFTGANGRNVVEIYASILEFDLNNEITWPVFKDKTPYRISSSLSVQAAWKVLPETIIEMGREAYLRIDKGFMKAVGTKDAKIVFRGAETMRGYWRGILFSTASANNIIEFAEIRDGGSQNLVSGVKANIAVHGSAAQMSVKNNTIQNSGGYGIYVSYHTIVNNDLETVNVFKDNLSGAILKQL